MTKELCANCSHKYKCDAEHLACPQFKFFVDTGRVSEATHRVPTRAIYIELFHTEPAMPPRKEIVCRTR
jgi:hypothetical protein